MEAKVYNKTGNEAGSITLPQRVFGVPLRLNLVHHVVVSMQANARSPVAHTKDRSEVSGGGRKPWRQKGTGRARHGSRRSPLWVGGGVTFGPRNERNYAKKINKKVKTKALASVLSEKLSNGKILFVENIALSDGKTKEAVEVFQGLSSIPGVSEIASRKRNNVLFAMASVDEYTKRGFRNFSNSAIKDIRSMNLLDVLKYKYLVIVDPKEAVKILEERVLSTPSAQRAYHG